MATLIGELRASLCPGRACLGRRQIDSGAARLGKSNGDRLLGGSCPMLSFADVMHLFADEFTRLRRWRFAFALVFLCTFECFFFWHVCSLLSPIEEPPPRPTCVQRLCQIDLLLQGKFSDTLPRTAR